MKIDLKINIIIFKIIKLCFIFFFLRTIHRVGLVCPITMEINKGNFTGIWAKNTDIQGILRLSLESKPENMISPGKNFTFIYNVNFTYFTKKLSVNLKKNLFLVLILQEKIFNIFPF